ncbi:hypothetical protein Godav_019866, partial [Gossypium davidsonii]|nr:hypothetical protein [Gossypium davidsonii]
HFITNPRKKVQLASIVNDHGGRASLKKGGSDYGRKLVGVTTLRARYSFSSPVWMSRHDMAGVKTSHDWCHDIDGRLLHWRHVAIAPLTCNLGMDYETNNDTAKSGQLIDGRLLHWRMKTHLVHRSTSLQLCCNIFRSVSEYCEHYTPFLVQAGCRNVTRQHFITNPRKKVQLASIVNDHGGRASLKKGGSDYGRKL